VFKGHKYEKARLTAKPRPTKETGDKARSPVKRAWTEAERSRGSARGRASARERGLARVSRRRHAAYGVHVRRQRSDLGLRVAEQDTEGMKEALLKRMPAHQWKGKTYTREGVATRVTLTGFYPCAPRRAQLVQRRRAKGRKHREALRRLKTVRAQHAEESERGVKRPGKAGSYRGYRVRVKGTLDGGLRTRRSEYGVGSVPWSSRDARRSVGRVQARTKVGTMGVSVVYCYGRARGRKGGPRPARRARGADART
jgi:hypothetical protein